VLPYGPPVFSCCGSTVKVLPYGPPVFSCCGSTVKVLPYDDSMIFRS